MPCAALPYPSLGLPRSKLGDAVLTNTAVAALGFRIPLVIANTVVAPIQAARASTQYLATGYAAYYRSPGKMTEMIHSLSPFMEERATSLDSSYQVVLGRSCRVSAASALLR